MHTHDADDAHDAHDAHSHTVSCIPTMTLSHLQTSPSKFFLPVGGEGGDAGLVELPVWGFVPRRLLLSDFSPEVGIWYDVPGVVGMDGWMDGSWMGLNTRIGPGLVTPHVGFLRDQLPRYLPYYTPPYSTSRRRGGQRREPIWPMGEPIWLVYKWSIMQRKQEPASPLFIHRGLHIPYLPYNRDRDSDNHGDSES